MRFAFRYIIAFVVLLVIVSIKLSLFSDETINLFRSRGNFQKLLGHNGYIGIGRISRDNSTTVFVHKPFQNDFVDYFKKDLNITSKGKNNILAQTWDEYRRNPEFITENALIDEYGKNDLTKTGENGRGVLFAGREKKKSEELLKKYNLNVYASDLIPLNRKIPDSRFKGCKEIQYPRELPSASIIIPFYDEWLSILLRTIYSIVNRTPRKLLKEIILVDDASELKELKDGLESYITHNFPKGLIKIIRAKKRHGLIKSRVLGWRKSTGEVVIFFDSHMEVNINWLQPLLTEIKNDRKIIALGTLDYIQFNSLEYKFYEDFVVRYGFDWRMTFFETYFRNDQVGERPEDPRAFVVISYDQSSAGEMVNEARSDIITHRQKPYEIILPTASALLEDARRGNVMVGAGFAIDSKYFEEIGMYDESMSIWGGENLELSWRVWLCGGRLLHVPCSHIGHIARGQPYTFPGGRVQVEVFNYKRVAEVWMEPEYRSYLYKIYPQMVDMDVGDLTERLELKKRLNCKPFSWLLEHIWPELLAYSQDVIAWGSARNPNSDKCLDNHQYLHQAPAVALYADVCHYGLPTQGFSWTKSKRLRTTLQCVVVKGETEGVRPQLEGCIIGTNDTWVHKRGGYIKHEKTGLCLDLDDTGPIMKKCSSSEITQIWQFNTYVEDEMTKKAIA